MLSKSILLVIFFVVVSDFTFGQSIKQFKVQEVIELFSKSQLQVKNFLSEKLYKSKGVNSGIETFEKITSLGKIIVLASFKNGKLNAISTMESLMVSDEVSRDLLYNKFKIIKLFNSKTGREMPHDLINNIAPFSGCVYHLQNLNLKWLKVTYMVSPYQSNIITLNYGK